MPALLSGFLPAQPLTKSTFLEPFARLTRTTEYIRASKQHCKVIAQMHNAVQKAAKQKHAPAQGLPTEPKKTLQPDSRQEHQHAARSDINASDRTYSVLVKDRGGSIPTDILSTQQRLQEVLSVDRQDTPAPGSQIREGHQVVATVIFPQDESPMMLPQAVEALFRQHFTSLTAAKKAIRRKELLVAGKVCNTTRVVLPGERIEWLQRVSTNKQLDHTQTPTKLQVVYEDEHMACVVKPQGMPTAQSGVAGKEDVKQCLPYSLKLSEVPGLLCRPQHVHRLDEATGGLLVVAKSRQGLKGLSAAFEHRQVQKTYRTLVGGRLEGEGYVDIPLDGKPSLTEYRSVSQSESGNHGWISTLDLLPHTGRMHQLRRHMALLGHPVLGDPRYTYGYANRHPDAPIKLNPAQTQQAMTQPFGASSDHPYHTPNPVAVASYAFWASQRLGLLLPAKPSGEQPDTGCENAETAANPRTDVQNSHSDTNPQLYHSAPRSMLPAQQQADNSSLGAHHTLSSMPQQARAETAQADPAEALKQLHRPHRAVTPQKPNAALADTSGLHPALTDLSLGAQARLLAAAPHYAERLNDQHPAASSQVQHQELPAGLQRMLCLWAVKLLMPHPLTNAEMQFSIPDPSLFHEVRHAEAELAWKLRQKESQ